jgi:hypothetical protein
MIMPSPTIVDYLKFSTLQFAAEAMLADEYGNLKNDVRAALINGNLRSTKFTQPQAKDFTDPVNGWTVVTQCPNTLTGFSGTLFKNNKTEELVISFRSTEFIDDAARDNEATDKMEIAKGGFALGQIADMEAWYAKLSQSGGLLEGKKFSVTGYSLGAHLATVFNFLHGKDIDQVVTFNGAGIGQIGKGTLAGMVERFQSLLKQAGIIQQPEAEENPDGLKSLFQSEAGQRAYLKLRVALTMFNPLGCTNADLRERYVA